MWFALFQQSVVHGPTPGQESTYYLEIALVVLASFLFGYVLRLFLNQRLHREIEELNNENLKLKSEYTDTSTGQRPSQPDSKLKVDNDKLRQDLDKAKAELGLVQKARESAEKQVKQLKEEVNKMKSGEKENLIPDDLTRIEGIGPKLAFILNEKGIQSFNDLSDQSSTSLQKILDEAGPAFKIMDPSTWPEQAELAANQKWKELAEFQEKMIENN